ncbi:hypothetical protein [Myroides guanonis]|uniref:DinB family protein n=1 Tax=Myroides guanonis TaxID=1150112 RepID=A0A1I3PDK9_9FLAO|nr:hypothetical protein [Myroides guanonis]SFJ19724.1 hypothetical protein SAMN04487893_10486 [Myroides guanonis]
MKTDQNKRAVNAILAEYERALNELQYVIVPISNKDLAATIDPHTSDPNGKSIRNILAHVIGSAFSYAIYIRESIDHAIPRPGLRHRDTALEYIRDLDEVIVFTRDTFKTIYDYSLEKFDYPDKIKTKWGQSYDIEQMMEHAIVHVLRHRRQIEIAKERLC